MRTPPRIGKCCVNYFAVQRTSQTKLPALKSVCCRKKLLSEQRTLVSILLLELEELTKLMVLGSCWR